MTTRYDRIRLSLVASALVEADIQFVYFDLTHSSNGCAQMVLEAVGNEAEERIYKPIVADDG